MIEVKLVSDLAFPCYSTGREANMTLKVSTFSTLARFEIVVEYLNVVSCMSATLQVMLHCVPFLFDLVFLNFINLDLSLNCLF